MTKALILGCSGFIAHHLIRELHEHEYETTGVDKRPIRNDHYMPHHFVQTDVFDLNYRDIAGMDHIFALAWRTNIPDCVRHPRESTRENIDMMVHVLELAKEAGVKKVFFPSTASLYGNNPTPWKEDMPAEPIEHYSWQKLACEQLCRMYSMKYEVPTVVTRFFQVFGELQRADTALAAFARAKELGKPITLTETVAQSSFRSGQRDFIYAGDAARAVRLLMEHEDEPGTGEIYNVASGRVYTMEEVACAIGGEVKWIPRRPYEVERHWGNINRIRDFGFEPKTDVIEWLKKTYGNEYQHKTK